MAKAVEGSDDELPELNALLKQPVQEQARRRAYKVPVSASREKQDMKSDLTVGKRRVRRLETKTNNTSTHLLRQWDPDRDGIVFAPRISPRTESTRELPPREHLSNKKGTVDAEVVSRGLENSRARACRSSKSRSSSPQRDDPTQKKPHISKATTNKSSTAPLATLKESEEASSLIKKEEKPTQAKQHSTTKLDAETSDEDSSGECPTTDDDSSEYQDSEPSDSSGNHPYQRLPRPPSSQASRISREVSKKRNDDWLNPSLEPHQPSRRDRQRKLGTGAKSVESRRTVQRIPPSQGHKALDDQGPSRCHATHEALDLAHDLSKLQLPLEESSDGYQTPEERENVKGPCLTPSKTNEFTGLNSPRKQVRIPATPHKPNTDIFWSQEFVNDWNDQHSRRGLDHAEFPAKSKVKTGQKKETKKSFAARKDQIAQEFLSQLDNRITEGKLTELAAATGGIKIVWSKTLNTTAGRANWRRETIRTTSGSTHPQMPTQFKHHASIELAEKVIDGEDRLLNVLAHEFCHLANFMINGITTNPHGKEFKAWATRCSREFAAQGINVTTKHTYEIDFKYMWTCDACEAQYKRHSKSIDPSRHRCGSCKGMLTQTKPIPRGAGAAEAKPSEYQIFMKENMKIVRSEYPGSPQKEVMKVVAERWSKRVQARGNKAAKSSEIVTQFVDLSLEGGHDLEMNKSKEQ